MRVVTRKHVTDAVEHYFAQRPGALHQRPELDVDTLDHFKVGLIQDALPGDEWLRGGITIPYRLWSPTGLNYSMVKVRRHNEGQMGKYQIAVVDEWLHAHDHSITPYYADPLLNASTVVVCEGEFDAMVASRLTDVAAMGIPGTQTWSRYYGYLLRGKRVVLALDADESGRQGATRIASALRDFECRVHTVALPEGRDISDVAREGGMGAVRKLLLG